jgi:hypothetical protein
VDTLENLGILGFMDPITAVEIRDRMRMGGVSDATTTHVSALWDAYQDAILEKKLPPFTKDADWIATFNDLVAVTQLPKMTVSGFLTALRAHASEKGTMQYLDPAQGQKSREDAKQAVKDIIAAPGNVIKVATKPVIDTAAAAGKAVSQPLMWVALGAVAIAAIYVTFQVAPAFKAAGKVKKRKG